MVYLFIYLFQLAEVIGYLKILSLVIAGILIVMSVCVVNVDSVAPITKTEENFVSGLGRAALVCLIISLGLCLFPTKQTLTLMGAAYLGEKTIQSNVVNTNYQRLTNIINGKLKLLEAQTDEEISKLNR